MVIPWRRILRHDGDYFRTRRAAIRRCVAHIHEVVGPLPRHPSRAEQWLFRILLVLIAALTLFAALASVRYLANLLNTEKRIAANADLQMLSGALESHYIEHNRYPADSEGLSVLAPFARTVDSNTGPDTVDPWGNRYVYESRNDGQSYVLLSLGADGKPGGRSRNRDQGFYVTRTDPARYVQRSIAD